MKALRIVVLLLCMLSPLIQSNAAPAHYPTFTAETSQGKIVYYRIGKGTPVILLHGLFANKEQWLELVAYLQAHDAPYQFIIPDLPGFGQSTGFPMTVYNLTVQDNADLNQVSVLHEFFTTIKLPIPFALVGNSLGGLIAERYTEAFPNDVSTLTFMGSPAGVTPFTEAYYHQLAQGYNPFIPLTASQLVEELKLLMVNVKAHLPSPKLSEALLTTNQKNYPKLAMIYMMISTYHHMRALMEPLPQIQIPVLIFWGLEDKLFGDIKYAYSLKSRFIHSPLKQVIPLEQAGHVVMLENEKVLKQIALKYLDFLKTANEQMNIQFA